MLAARGDANQDSRMAARAGALTGTIAHKFSIGFSLFLRELALEMTFNLFTTQWISCVGQNDRIDDFMACDLCSDKCRVLRQFLVNEFHFPAVFQGLNPLVVWHVRSSPGEVSVSGEYTRIAAGNFGSKIRSRHFKRVSPPNALLIMTVSDDRT